MNAGKTRLPILLTLLLLTLAAPLLRADSLPITLANNTLTGVAGSSVTFQATADNSLNSQILSIGSDFPFTNSPLITIDDTPFLLSWPFTVAAGGMFGPADLFIVNIAPGATPGLYTGTFTIDGSLGTAPESVVLNFTVDVPSNSVPEPRTLTMLLLGAALAGVLSLLKLRFA